MRAKHTRLAGEPLNHSGKLPGLLAGGFAQVRYTTPSGLGAACGVHGNLPEWSRGSPAKRVCFARTGSNPVVVEEDLLFGCAFYFEGGKKKFPVRESNPGLVGERHLS